MAASVAVLLLVSLPAPAAAADVEGSADHPAISRYPDSEITHYRVFNHTPYKIAVGPVTGYRHIDDWVETEGRLTRVFYTIENGKTVSDVYANYDRALKDAGFEILAQGFFAQHNVKKDVGGRSFIGVAQLPNPALEGSAAILNAGTSTSGGAGYIAAKKDRNTGPLYLVMMFEQHSAKTVGYLIDVIEAQAAETGLVTVDAAAMGKDIDARGRTVLRGLYFDTDQATIKAESKPALDEIAKLLRARAEMQVYIVGHTDADGSLSHNMQLSAARAKAVTDALAGDYAIDAARLDPHGVGPLSPLDSNAGDAGKAENRRVEMVER